MSVLTRSIVGLKLTATMTRHRPRYAQFGGEIRIGPFSNLEAAREWEREFTRILAEYRREDDDIEFSVKPGEVQKLLHEPQSDEWDVETSLYSPEHLVIELKHYIHKAANDGHYEEPF